jgi:hypothetical protein
MPLENNISQKQTRNATVLSKEICILDKYVTEFTEMLHNLQMRNGQNIHEQKKETSFCEERL